MATSCIDKQVRSTSLNSPTRKPVYIPSGPESKQKGDRSQVGCSMGKPLTHGKPCLISQIKGQRSCHHHCASLRLSELGHLRYIGDDQCTLKHTPHLTDTAAQIPCSQNGCWGSAEPTFPRVSPKCVRFRPKQI